MDIRVYDVSVDQHDMPRRLLVLLQGFTEPQRPRRRIVGHGLRLGETKSVEIELLAQVGVPPLFQAGGRHGDLLVCAPRMLTPLTKPHRLPDGETLYSSGVESLSNAFHRSRFLQCSACHQPTDPSISSSIRRLSSTAYSSGSSFAIGSMKPRTIMAIASS